MIPIRKAVSIALWTALVAVVAVFLVLYARDAVLSKKPADPYGSRSILFEGAGCAHCVTVDQFIAANNVGSKIDLVKLEVFNTPQNASILADRSQSCGLDFQQVGVPFFWDGAHKKCILGDAAIIHFLQEEISGKTVK